MPYDSFAWLFTFAAIGFVALWICREILCWYWKVNEMIELMKRNNQLLEIIAKNTDIASRPPP